MITVTIDTSQILIFLICIFYTIYRMFVMIGMCFMMLEKIINEDPLKHKRDETQTQQTPA